MQEHCLFNHQPTLGPLAYMSVLLVDHESYTVTLYSAINNYYPTPGQEETTRKPLAVNLYYNNGQLAILQGDHLWRFNYNT